MTIGNAFSLILALVPSIVKGIQVTVGDSIDGASKAKMAQDALSVAVNGTSNVLTGSNAVYAQVAGQVAQVAIDQTVAIAKQNGSYAKWTEAANAATQDVAIAGAVAGVVQAVQGTQGGQLQSSASNGNATKVE